MSQLIIRETSGYRKPGLRATSQNVVCTSSKRSCVMNVRGDPLPFAPSLPSTTNFFFISSSWQEKKSSEHNAAETG